MSTLNGGELAANAARALERYRAEERALEAEIAERVTRLAMMREFIAALTAAPRPARKPRAVEGQAVDPPEPPQTDMDAG
jgi:anti-sigma factor RsiW